MNKNILKSKVLLLIVIILVLGILAIIIFKPLSNKDLIRNQIYALGSLGNKTTNEKVITEALKINATDKIFAPKFSLSIGYDMFAGEYTPREFTATLARYRAILKEAKVKVSDISIEITTPTTAQVEFVAELNGETKSEVHINEVKDLICYLAKIDNKWLINKIEIHEVIKK